MKLIPLTNRLSDEDRHILARQAERYAHACVSAHRVASAGWVRLFAERLHTVESAVVAFYEDLNR